MRSSGGLLVAAILLAGFAQLLVMPPFEGFDEIAHYSYIREIADTHRIPVFGRSTIATIVADYRRRGPMPYSAAMPFDQNGSSTYATFFANRQLQEAYLQRYRSQPRVTDTRYRPGTEYNWEAQHPPLYYGVLAPLMRATDSLSFNTQLFSLRAVSFLFAVGGLMIGLSGTIQVFAKDAAMKRAMMAATLLYPFLIPMFFPEFGRIGNDSLCILLVGVMWTLLLKVVERQPDQRSTAALGLTLGLGLLTKAFFLPIGTGICAYLLYRAWTVRDNSLLATIRIKAFLTVAVVAGLVGGWWYIYKFIAYNSITGGAELITLDAKGGLLLNLHEKFEPGYFARAFVALFASAYYTGSWSLARLPEALYLPGLVLLCAIAFFCARELRQTSLSALPWAPLWIAIPVVAGFIYFILARIALEGSGNNIAGWYLNVLAPPTAVLLGLGLNRGLMVTWFRRLAAIAVTYAVLFFIAGQWAQAALFSGCAIKPASTKYYVFSDGLFCLTKMPDMTHNLAVIAWPIAGAICFVAALVCLVVGAQSLLRVTSEDVFSGSFGQTDTPQRASSRVRAHRRQRY